MDAEGYFKNLDLNLLKQYANEWVDNYHNINFDRIELRRYSPIRKYAKHARTQPTTIYAVVFITLEKREKIEGDEHQHHKNQITGKIPIPPFEKFESDTQYNQTIYPKRYEALIGSDFRNIYHRGCFPGDNYVDEWVFIPLAKNEELPLSINRDWSEVVLWECGNSLPSVCDHGTEESTLISEDSNQTPFFLKKSWQQETVKNALLSGFIAVDNLVYIMAIDDAYDEMIPNLYEKWDCHIRKPNPHSTIEMWTGLLDRLSRGGLCLSIAASAPDFGLIPVYWQNPKTGEYKEQEPDFWKQTDSGIRYFNLEDIKSYFSEKLEIPLPQMLFTEYNLPLPKTSLKQTALEVDPHWPFKEPPLPIERHQAIERDLWGKYIDPIVKKHNLILRGDYFQYRFMEKDVDEKAVYMMRRKIIECCFAHDIEVESQSESETDQKSEEDIFFQLFIDKLLSASPGNTKTSSNKGQIFDLKEAFHRFLRTIIEQETLPEFLILLRDYVPRYYRFSNHSDPVPRDEIRERLIWKKLVQPLLTKCGLYPDFNYQFVKGDFKELYVWRVQTISRDVCNGLTPCINTSFDLLLAIRDGIQLDEEQKKCLRLFFRRIFSEGPTKDRVKNSFETPTLFPAFLDLISHQKEFSEDNIDNELIKRHLPFDPAKYFDSLLKSGKDKFNDWENVVFSIPKEIMHQDLAATILEIPNSEMVAYYLGKNIGEAERISQMSPFAMAAELGKIERKISKTTKKTSKAPPPVNTLSGRGQSASRNYVKPKPEYDHWKMMAYWSLLQASYLVCDCDPEYEKKIKPGSGQEIDPGLRIEINKKHDIIYSNYMARNGELKKAPGSPFDKPYVDPFEFIKWAINRGLDVPGELRGMIKGEGETDFSLNSKQENIEDKSRQKLRQDTADKLEMQKIAEDIWLTQKIDLDIKYMTRHPEIIKIHNRFKAYKERRVHDILSEVAPNNAKKPGRRSKDHTKEQESLCKKLGITIPRS